MRRTIVGALLLVASFGGAGECGLIGIGGNGPISTTIGADGALTATLGRVLIIPTATPLNPTTSITPTDGTVTITLPTLWGSVDSGYTFAAGGSFLATGRLTSQGPLVTLASAALTSGQLIRFTSGQDVEFALFLGTDQHFDVGAGLAAFYGLQPTGSGTLGATFLLAPAGLVGLGSQANITASAAPAVTEPSSGLLAGLGLACLAIGRRRRQVARNVARESVDESGIPELPPV